MTDSVVVAIVASDSVVLLGCPSEAFAGSGAGDDDREAFISPEAVLEATGAAKAALGAVAGAGAPEVEKRTTAMARIMYMTPIDAYFIAWGKPEQWYSQGSKLVRPVFSVTCEQGG